MVAKINQVSMLEHKVENLYKMVVTQNNKQDQKTFMQEQTVSFILNTIQNIT